jgi:hypothetical protein
MGHCRDGKRKAAPVGAGLVALIAALVVLAPVPESAAATSGTTTPTGDALYQPVPFGSLSSFDTSNVAYNFPVVGMASTPDGAGYWLVASDGGVFSYGDARFYGSTGATSLNKPIVGMAATPTGRGYWLVASDGGVFAFGDARFYGSTGAITLNRPIVGMASTPDGGGYWLAASDGGVFSYGDAPFSGSLGGLSLNDPVVGIGGARNGDGYWLVGSDGGVFTFGAATYYGSLGGQTVAYPIAGMAVDPDGGGYWLLPITTLPTATLGTWTGIEPSSMQFSGDSGNIVSHIDWSSWSTSSATGVGSWGYNDCVPDCAGGMVTDYPAMITLSRPSEGRFTELTEDQSGPFGSTFTFSLPGSALRASS